jgi:hypothetical protein
LSVEDYIDAFTFGESTFVGVCFMSFPTTAETHIQPAQQSGSPAFKFNGSSLENKAVDAAVAALNSPALRVAGQIAGAALSAGLMLECGDIVDVVEVASECASNKMPERVPDKVTAEDVRSAARFAVNTAAVVGLVSGQVALAVAADVASRVNPQQHQADIVLAPVGAANGEWNSGLFDCCSGGIGMFFDALFCGTCLYYSLQEDLGTKTSISQCCLTPCTWCNPFWMCGSHPRLRWQVAQRYNIPVRHSILATHLCLLVFS